MRIGETKTGPFKAMLRVFVMLLGIVTSAGIDPLSFNKDIRPILSEHCFACHGPDESQRKGKLRLDVRESALRKKAIVPGQPSQSFMVERIFNPDPDEVMPPPGAKKPLTSAQKTSLRRWIQEGASYEIHWSYSPLQKPSPPRLERSELALNTIDAFIVAELEKRQLQPSPPATRSTLLRRLSLDLIGLPPTVHDLRTFLNDTGKDAYERVVNRLLESPHYGERMAVPWLDAVRFADSVGYHSDPRQNIFPYRDYVINSFNENKPFNQFTIEQLAGDLLPHPTQTQIIATGFNRLGMMTREGGAQPKEYLAKYAAERVRALSLAWLGSTIGCAECHDHKYDPFTTRDFYQLAAFFADVKQWGVYADRPFTPNPELKGFDDPHPFPPEAIVDSPYLKQREERTVTKMSEVALSNLQSAASVRNFEAWCAASLDFVKNHPKGWAPSGLTLVPKRKGEEAPATLDQKGLSLVGRRLEDVRLRLNPQSREVSAIRLQALVQRPGDTGSATNLDHKPLRLTAFLRKQDGKESNLGFYFADADTKEPQYANGVEKTGIGEGWVLRKETTRFQNSVWLLDPPLRLKAGEEIAIELQGQELDFVAVSVSPFASRDPLSPMQDQVFFKALRAKTARELSNSSEAAEVYLWSTGESRDAFLSYKRLFEDYVNCRHGKAPTMITVRRDPMVTRILPRGNWQDESGEIVSPAFPQFLPQITKLGSRLTRLDLAQWLVSPNNPLTARTFVNRIWKEFFGRGLCSTPDDLGTQGDRPSHPELLDWLAADFREHGWNVKRLIKQIVMSSTYQQDSNPDDGLRERDPNNSLFATQTPRRLEAEFIRDNALAIAGLLTSDIGGPSAHPYQPIGYYASIGNPPRRYYPEHDDRQYRRGVYTHWQRTFLHPMLLNFDAPSREECTANRFVSTTPQQALTLLNDPSFFEAARSFATRVLNESTGPDADRVSQAFEIALARRPRSPELHSLLGFLSRERKYWQNHLTDGQKMLQIGDQPVDSKHETSELAAWTALCRVILNLHETIVRY